jgi:hypothetical protein
MEEHENEQSLEPAAPIIDELAMEAAREVSEEFLIPIGTILAEVDGIPGEQEEERIYELLKEASGRVNDLIEQRRRERSEQK